MRLWVTSTKSYRRLKVNCKVRCTSNRIHEAVALVAVIGTFPAHAASLGLRTVTYNGSPVVTGSGTFSNDAGTAILTLDY